MKKITLKNLSAKGFRGKSFSYDFGEKTVIEGRNRRGKSTVKNAFFWLLTGCDDQDRSNHNLFDNGVEQTKENSSPVEVNATIVIDDIEYTLTRIAKVGWIRPRGQEEYVRKGNDDYSFAINEIDRSATEYKSWIEENIAPIDILKCAMNTDYFLYILPDWKSQRALLTKIAGEVKDEDLKGEYTELFEQFKKYTAEELKERLKNLLSPLKKALGTESTKGTKEVEIETLKTNLVDISGVEEAEKTITAYNSVRQQILDKIKGITAVDEETAKKRTEILNEVCKKNDALIVARMDFERRESKDILVLKHNREQIVEGNMSVQRDNAKAIAKRESDKKDIARLEEAIKTYEARLESLREKNISIKSKEFVASKCPTCGQELPEAEIAKLKEIFEKEKESERQFNIAEGKSVKASLEKKQQELAELKEEVAKELVLKSQTSLDEIDAQITERSMKVRKFEDTEEYAKMVAEIESLKTSMPEIGKTDTSELDGQLAECNAKIADATKVISLKGVYEMQIQSIKKAQEELKTMAQERASLEKIEYQLAAYEQEKSDIVGQRVNKYFKKCKVQMFDIKKDGQMTPNCVITMDGTKSTTLNKEGTITAGVDVTNAFCEHYEINLPLFVDDYESLSDDNYVETDRQFIALRVANSEVTVKSL